MSLHAASGHYMLNYMSITGIITRYYMLPWSITWTLHAALIHYMFKFIQWFLVMAAAAADAIALPARSARCRDRRGGWDSWDKQCLECPWCDRTIFEQSCQIQRYNQLDHQTKSWLMRNRLTPPFATLPGDLGEMKLWNKATLPGDLTQTEGAFRNSIARKSKQGRD